MQYWLKKREIKVMPKCLLSVVKKSKKVSLLIFLFTPNQINKVKQQKVILQKQPVADILQNRRALVIFTILIGIQLCWSLFLVKLQE